MNFCLVGSDIKRSLSPLLHSLFFKAEGVDCSYVLRDCKSLPDFLSGDLFDGINITAPFKILAASTLPTDPIAFRVQAVNCVYKGKGFNTDYTAFLEELDSILAVTPIKTALIVGRGGVARAVAAAFSARGIEFSVAVRNFVDFAVNGLMPLTCFVDIMHIKNSYDLMVNATPYGRDLSLPPVVKEEVVKKSKFVFDTIYYDTTLCALAERNGIPNKNGLDMLISQGIHSHKIWGLPYEKIDAKKIVLEIKNSICL